MKTQPSRLTLSSARARTSHDGRPFHARTIRIPDISVTHHDSRPPFLRPEPDYISEHDVVRPTSPLDNTHDAMSENSAAAPDYTLIDDKASTIDGDRKDTDVAFGADLVPANTGAHLTEIHNHQNKWSTIRTRFREPLAEFLAVCKLLPFSSALTNSHQVLVQLTLGLIANLSALTSAPPGTPTPSTAWSWGLSTTLAIYIAGGISGAHLNPATSITLSLYRGFPASKLPSYIAAQVLAALVAALLSYALFRSTLLEHGPVDHSTLDAFVTGPRHPYVTIPTAFFTEFVGTAFLSVAVLALGDDSNAPPGAGMGAFIIGLVVVALCMELGTLTGAALNPSRDFGPRLALAALGHGREVFDGGLGGYWGWGVWGGTVAGAVVGAGVYDVAVFTGGESPVNFPRRGLGRRWGVGCMARLRRKI